MAKSAKQLQDEFDAAIAQGLKDFGVKTDKVPGPGTTVYKDGNGDDVTVRKSR